MVEQLLTVRMLWVDFNFITRDKFVGFEGTASHQEIDGSDGVHEAAFIAGLKMEELT